MKKVVFQMEPFSCPSCIKKIENSLGRQRGVEHVKVLFHSGKIRVQFDESFISAEALENIIIQLGYPIKSKKIV